jgi:hypothetical protein
MQWFYFLQTSTIYPPLLSLINITYLTTAYLMQNLFNVPSIRNFRPILDVFQSLFSYLRLYSPCKSWLLFKFLNLYTVGRTPWMGDQPIARPILIHRTHNKRTQTFMPQVGSELTIPVFERPKTVHALDRAASVIGIC